MMKNDIFEDMMSQLTHCRYISDLRPMIHSELYKNEVFKVIENLSVHDYSFEQWSELYYYLFGKKTIFTTPQEVQKALLAQIEK